jgi:hypothetical protein
VFSCFGSIFFLINRKLVFDLVFLVTLLGIVEKEGEEGGGNLVT